MTIGLVNVCLQKVWQLNVSHPNVGPFRIGVLPG